MPLKKIIFYTLIISNILTLEALQKEEIGTSSLIQLMRAKYVQKSLEFNHITNFKIG